MPRFPVSAICLAALLAAMLGFPAAAQASPIGLSAVASEGFGVSDGGLSYTVTDLGPRQAKAINNAGQVAGSFSAPTPYGPGYYGPTLGFLYNSYGPHAGQVTNFGAIDPTGFNLVNSILAPGGAVFVSSANGINANGQVAGSSIFSLGHLAFDDPIYATVNQAGQTNVLGVIGIERQNVAVTSINNAGEVVGNSTAFGPNPTELGASHNAFALQHGVMTNLGTLGGAWSSAAAVNNAGVVVGQSQLPANGPDGFGVDHAFAYNPSGGGHMTDLGTLGGDFSNATAINDLGQIVGSSNPRNSLSHAFLYSGGTMHDLGTLSGSAQLSESEAHGINAQGQVVGTSTAQSMFDQILHPHPTFLDPVAFLYDHGNMFDLNALAHMPPGTFLSDALGINDLGQIIAGGYDRLDGKGHSYLLTPVGLPQPAAAAPIPEPASWLAFTLLLGAAGAFRWSRARGL